MDAFETSLEVEEQRTYNKVQQFMIFSAGARSKILKECPTDEYRFFVIGGAVIITTIAAFFSGFYASSKIFNDSNLSIFLGAFWATIIYNTDRSIIISLGNKKTISNFRGINLQPLVILPSLAIRIGIAFFIAVSVDVPLEIKIFEKSIAAHRGKLALDEKKIVDSIARVKEGIPQIESELSSIGKENDLLNKERENISKDPYIENLITVANVAKSNWESISNKNRSIIGSLNRDISELRNSKALSNDLRQQSIIDEEINNKKSEIGKYNKEVQIALNNYERANKTYLNEYNKIRTRIENEINNNNDIEAGIRKRKPIKDSLVQRISDTIGNKIDIKFDDNLVADIKALSSLRQEDPTYKSVSLGIMGVIILIELLPLLLKLFSGNGLYEAKIETIEFEIMRDEERKRHLKHQEYQEAIKQHSTLIKIRLDTEIKKEDLLASERNKLVKSVVEKVTIFQRELINKYIKIWYEKESKKADEQVEQFKQEGENLDLP